MESNNSNFFTDIDALILAGGMGTRLKEVLPNRQKVIAPVSGEPFVLRLIDVFKSVGIKRVILALGHGADDVLDVIANSAPPEIAIVKSIENEPLGTAGALRHALPLMCSDKILVTNGDSYINADLRALLKFHITSKADITMTLSEVDNVSRYGLVSVNSIGEVITFHEKQESSFGRGIINAGMYCIQREIIKKIPLGNVSLEKDVLPKFCKNGLFGIKLGNRFIDIGTPDDYFRAANFFAQTKNKE